MRGLARRSVGALVGLALALGPAWPAAAEEDTLAAAVRQIQDGDLSAAVVTLDSVARRLQAAGGGAALVEVHVRKGEALVGLGQEGPAKEAFREALRLSPGLRLSKGDFPDRVVRVFEAARTGKSDSVMERPSGAPKKAGLGAGTIALIAGGVALAGGGAAVAAGGGGSSSSSSSTSTGSTTTGGTTNHAPTARIDLWEVEGGGVAINEVTKVSFAGSGTDPDGDAVTLTWDFADRGSTATGNAVVHKFSSAGEHQVKLIAQDSKGASTESAPVTVASDGLAGPWEITYVDFGGGTSVNLKQEGNVYNGTGAAGETVKLTVTNPRDFVLSISRYPGCEVKRDYAGTVSLDARSMTGIGPGCTGGEVTMRATRN